MGLSYQQSNREFFSDVFFIGRLHYTMAHDKELDNIYSGESFYLFLLNFFTRSGLRAEIVSIPYVSDRGGDWFDDFSKIINPLRDCLIDFLCFSFNRATSNYELLQMYYPMCRLGYDLWAVTEEALTAVTPSSLEREDVSGQVYFFVHRRFSRFLTPTSAISYSPPLAKIDRYGIHPKGLFLLGREEGEARHVARALSIDQIVVTPSIDRLKGPVVGCNILVVSDIELADASKRVLSALLTAFDAVQFEVAFDEGHKGWSTLRDVDAFLSSHEFIRIGVEIRDGTERGWAAYVRCPVFTCRRFNLNGRFGNQFFQYLFLRYYELESGFRLVAPEWRSGTMFRGVTQPPPCELELPRWSEDHSVCKNWDYFDEISRIGNIDFNGYFQYNTSFYRPFKTELLKNFEWTDRTLELVNALRNWLSESCKEIVCLHLRRGDYGISYFFFAPSRWYMEWLDRFFDRRRHIVYVASDEEDVLREFRRYGAVSFRDFPLRASHSPEVVDFLVMTLCDRLAISNSTFSLAASMINTHAKEFVRPRLSVGGLIDYDPWQTYPIFKDELVEDFGLEFSREGIPWYTKLRRRLRKSFRKRVKKWLGRK